MRDRNDSFNKVDRALDDLGAREWRTPELGTLTTKEFAMTVKNGRKLSRNRIVALVGALAVVGAGTAFGAAYAMGAFRGKIVTDKGQEFDVEMTETAQGVYEGTTAEGHQVRFITEEAGGENRIDMFIKADEPGEEGTYTFSVDTEDLHNQWAAQEAQKHEEQHRKQLHQQAQHHEALKKQEQAEQKPEEADPEQ
ncbi:MAG: hypothetical protein H6814_04510 [Phycisphaeraceae bacterium]|nr:hypothetical protein [Phycisphaeraceae bacterium]